MRAREAEFGAVPVRLCFVGTGTPAQAQAFAEEHAGPHPVLCDPDRATFARAGMRRGVGTLLRWSLLRGVWRALRAGFRQARVQGDPWQQGGLLVFAADGSLRHRQVDRGGGELLDLDAALAALAAP